MTNPLTTDAALIEELRVAATKGIKGWPHELFARAADRLAEAEGRAKEPLHVDFMNDYVAMGLARDSAEERASAAEASLATTQAKLEAARGEQLSHADACCLSLYFNRAASLANPQHARINEWLKATIARLTPAN